MKTLTVEEFNTRLVEVNKALKIFAPLTTNISEAFAIYQEVLAQEKMEVFISGSTANAANISIFNLSDEYEKLTCPECESVLAIRIKPVDYAGVQWETSCICSNCYAEFYSEKTIQEWMNELKKRSD